MFAARILIAVALMQVIGVEATWAQAWTAGVRGSATSGYSDNILSSPDDTTVGLPPPTADFFYQLRTEAGAQYETPRMRSTLAYALNGFIYQDNADVNSVAHELRLQTRWEMSRRTNLDFEAAVGTGDANTLLLQQRPETGTSSVVPGGDRTVKSLIVGQRLRHELTRTLTLRQEYDVRVYRTDEPSARTRGSQLSLTVGADHQRPRDAIGGELILSFIDLDRSDLTDPNRSLANSMLDATMSGLYQRQLSRTWSATGRLGMTVTTGPSPGLTDRFRPAISAEVAHTDEWGQLLFTYQRAVSANLLIARRTVADSLTARGWMPLRWFGDRNGIPKVSIAGSLAAERGNNIQLETGENMGKWTAYLGDAALVWSPSRAFQASLRAQRVVVDADDLGTVFSYSRNTISLVLTGTFGTEREQPPRLGRYAQDEEAEDETR